MKRKYNCPACGGFLSLDKQEKNEEELQVDATCRACGFRGMAILAINNGIVRWPERIRFEKLDVLVV